MPTEEHEAVKQWCRDSLQSKYSAYSYLGARYDRIRVHLHSEADAAWFKLKYASYLTDNLGDVLDWYA